MIPKTTHEAESPAQRGRELSHEQDVITQALWRQLQALVHARPGEHPRGEPLAREAVTITERTDALNWRGDNALFAEVPGNNR